MKLQDQVCTLEQAKKLNELGITQGLSVFFYDTWMADKNKLQYNSGHQSGGEYKNAESCFSAFTVAELGIMLPSETLTIRRGSEDSEYPNWEWENESNKSGWGCFKTEAEARADHLIVLLLGRLITAEEVNKRLKQ